MRYIDDLLTLPPDNADHPLIIGQAVHTGIEKDVQTAIQEYYMSYPVITDRHIEEAMKLEKVIPKAKLLIPEGEFEVKIDNEHFVGYIDLLAPATAFERGVEIPNQFDLYDFKYSNNVSNYRKSKQLHLYKYFWEKANPGKFIRNMYFLFVPKTSIRQKKTEDLHQFRKRIESELDKLEPNLVSIEYDPSQVIEFMLDVKNVLEASEFPKNESFLCNYCEYQDYCLKGWDYMLLPKNERRNIEKIEKKVIWMYGSPFSGKTTFANQFPDPLMLNTDGNIKFVDAPFIPIKDQVSVEGRMTKRKLAWDTFKDVIAELEKKQNDFKTIIVDLLEDTYEHCRLFMYDQMGISHESDDSFRAWDKVRTEFLSTLKKLMALDYENIILISHEDTSKDITKKGGDKITAIKPNLQEKTANKVAGMVDIVARVIADGEIRTLSFKTNEVVFGGGRLTASTNEIQLDYAAFLEVYEEANKNAVAKLKGKEATKPSDKATEGRKPRGKANTAPETEEATATENQAPDAASEPEVDAKSEAETEEQDVEQEQQEEPKTRTRSRKPRGEEKASDEAEQSEQSEQAEQAEQTEQAEAPKTRTRRKRGE
ncbi:phage nucleotide-binding protein [Fontibacillus solani]|uniref:Phage nucleotide-binding protein n=1 Tax=Fontibacillus solani TaxID=1572857 RepID=A0A7W3XT84_9BACL|nr:phage nucleotide-binding protein [Fontibacillus solani]